jgi:hypothetical protein
VKRRDLIETVEVGRRDLQRRTELLRGWTVNDGPRRALRMIVSGRDSRIEMVAFEMMMIGMTIMAQTAFQCLSRSGINKEKRKQDRGDFSHGINLEPLLFQKAGRGYRHSALTDPFFSFSIFVIAPCSVSMVNRTYFDFPSELR